MSFAQHVILIWISTVQKNSLEENLMLVIGFIKDDTQLVSVWQKKKWIKSSSIMKPLWITQWCVTVADSRFRIHRWLVNYLKGAKLRSNYIWLYLNHLVRSVMVLISQRWRLWKPCLIFAWLVRMNWGLGTEQRDTSLTRKSCAYARSSNLAQRIW